MKIVSTTYPHVFGKYGDMEERMDCLGRKAEKKRLCKCVVCNQPFQKDDDVYLAMMERGRNKFVCGNCAARL